jgi:protein-disulfide isomerase
MTAKRRTRAKHAGGTRGPRAGAAPTTRPRWHRILDAVGGLPVVVPIGVAILATAGLILLNRPGDSGAAPYEPIVRAATAGRIDGEPSAPVRIVVYADFQCPFCRRAYDEIEPALRSEFVATGVAAIEYQHLAILGEESVRAAEASECALAQGFFWEYHDMLFQQQPSDGRENIGTYTPDKLKAYAREVADRWRGVDPARTLDERAFDTCVDTRATAAEVRRQTADGLAVGVRTTPTFLVNGVVIRGAQPIDVFRSVIREATQPR